MLPQYGWTLLTISAEHGHTIAVHKLLNLGASVNSGTEVLLSEAIRSVDDRGLGLSHTPHMLSCFREISRRDVQSGTTPVYAAARGGHWHIVDALIKRGADVNQSHQVTEEAMTLLSLQMHMQPTDIIFRSLIFRYT